MRLSINEPQDTACSNSIAAATQRRNRQHTHTERALGATGRVWTSQILMRSPTGVVREPKAMP